MNAQDAMKGVATSALVAGVAVLILAAIVWGTAFVIRRMKPSLEGFVVRVSAAPGVGEELGKLLKEKGAAVLADGDPMDPHAEISVEIMDARTIRPWWMGYVSCVRWTMQLSAYNEGAFTMTRTFPVVVRGTKGSATILGSRHWQAIARAIVDHLEPERKYGKHYLLLAAA